MKILYVSNHREGTGWSNAAIDNILALDSVGVDVVPRNLPITGQVGEVPQRIVELEGNDVSNVDICIQHTLPHYYSFNNKFKNVGYYFSETHNIDCYMWHKYINIMDAAIVPTNLIKSTSEGSGVKIPIHVSPLAIDAEPYKRIEKTIYSEELENSFNFYYVGDISKRKNIAAMLRAFHSEFHHAENVNLMLKVHQTGIDHKSVSDLVMATNESVTRGLKLSLKHKEPIVISGMLPSKDLRSIMKQCDVFVCSSYGEGWCIPAMQSMAMGNPVIYTDGTSMSEFCVGWPVKSNTVPCYGAIDAGNMYNGHDSWQEIDVQELRHAMRTSMTQIEEKRKQIDMNRFSYNSVGNKLKEILCKIAQE